MTQNSCGFPDCYTVVEHSHAPSEELGRAIRDLNSALRHAKMGLMDVAIDEVERVKNRLQRAAEFNTKDTHP